LNANAEAVFYATTVTVAAKTNDGGITTSSTSVESHYQGFFAAARVALKPLIHGDAPIQIPFPPASATETSELGSGENSADRVKCCSEPKPNELRFLCTVYSRTVGV